MRAKLAFGRAERLVQWDSSPRRRRQTRQRDQRRLCDPNIDQRLRVGAETSIARIAALCCIGPGRCTCANREQARHSVCCSSLSDTDSTRSQGPTRRSDDAVARTSSRRSNQPPTTPTACRARRDRARPCTRSHPYRHRHRHRRARPSWVRRRRHRREAILRMRRRCSATPCSCSQRCPPRTLADAPRSRYPNRPRC